MTVKELIAILEKMPKDAVVGREADDGYPGAVAFFEEYTVCEKADEADGNIVFIF